MGALYLDPREKEGIGSIDVDELGRLIDVAIDQQQLGGMHGLALTSCGPYVSSSFRRFDESLVGYRAAKSTAKRESTRRDAVKAGSDLVFALRQMRARMETEERESELFRIDDAIWEPVRLTPELHVEVSYRWRRRAEYEWTRGAIRFTHVHEPRPDYSASDPWHRPKRKLSAAKQAEEQQTELRRTWEHFRDIALYTVRDYLRDHRDDVDIPTSFKSRTDGHGGGINNNSLKFW